MLVDNSIIITLLSKSSALLFLGFESRFFLFRLCPIFSISILQRAPIVYSIAHCICPDLTSTCQGLEFVTTFSLTLRALYHAAGSVSCCKQQ